MKTVHEVSQLTGVSVRTLHHYDAIGLLKPTAVTAAGYRLYNNSALQTLQTILLFRELRFSLKEIKSIIEHPEFDAQEALRQQIHLLEMQRDQTERLIGLAYDILQKGSTKMDFTAFDKSNMTQYAEEVKARWGNTAAYQESQQRTVHRSDKENNEIANGLIAIFTKFGAIKNSDPASPKALALVKELQDYITANYYTCTPEILPSLGAMYTEDERFRANIDKMGGDGTAAYAAQAIAAYCE